MGARRTISNSSSCSSYVWFSSSSSNPGAKADQVSAVAVFHMWIVPMDETEDMMGFVGCHWRTDRERGETSMSSENGWVEQGETTYHNVLQRLFWSFKDLLERSFSTIPDEDIVRGFVTGACRIRRDVREQGQIGTGLGRKRGGDATYLR